MTKKFWVRVWKHEKFESNDGSITIGSGRHPCYVGDASSWPRLNSRFVLERTEATRHRDGRRKVFKTSVVVEVMKLSKDIRVFKTRHGSVYSLEKATTKE